MKPVHAIAATLGFAVGTFAVLLVFHMAHMRDLADIARQPVVVAP